MKRSNFPGRKKQRREEAVQRQEEWNSLSVEEKIARLENRGYGEGVEVKKLQKLLK